MRKSLIGGVPFSPPGGRVLRSPTPAEVFGGGGGSGPNVKAASAMYNSKRWVGKHCRSGEEVYFAGKAAELPSERDFAMVGVLMKAMARSNSQVKNAGLTEHEAALLNEVMHEELWSGEIAGQGYVKNIKFGEMGLRASLLTDSGSGGLHVTPAFFDQAIISYPLLYGELFPYVDVIDVPQSNRIATASIATPTVGWGTAEGTPVSPFDATSMIAAITADVENAKCAVRIGNDLLADSPVALGSQIASLIGMAFAKALDEVIAVGDGMSEPLGILTAPGTIAVGSVNGTSGPLAIADAEQLCFAIGKQYRGPAMGCAFIGNDTGYRRFRAVPVGTSDQRRVFGMDHQSYSLLEYPFKVQNDISEGQLAFGALKKYRLWRRMGMSLKMTSEGSTLTLADETLMFCKMRVAGKPVDLNAFAVMSDAPATG